MAKCPRIQTCELPTMKSNYDHYCKKHYKDCFAIIQRRTPREWRQLEQGKGK